MKKFNSSFKKTSLFSVNVTQVWPKASRLLWTKPLI